MKHLKRVGVPWSILDLEKIGLYSIKSWKRTKWAWYPIGTMRVLVRIVWKHGTSLKKNTLSSCLIRQWITLVLSFHFCYSYGTWALIKSKRLPGASNGSHYSESEWLKWFRIVELSRFSFVGWLEEFRMFFCLDASDNLNDLDGLLSTKSGYSKILDELKFPAFQTGQ
jgi:hypothetical protein